MYLFKNEAGKDVRDEWRIKEPLNFGGRGSI